MDPEVEIPIWYNGKMKWISNLTTHSTCYEVIQAILSTNENQSNDDYILFESWRGVERPLKSRCRLLKLWNSWASESQNVTLTLRAHPQQLTSAHFLIQQQGKKLEKLKRQLKRTDKQIEKVTNVQHDNNQSLLSYLELYHSIVKTQTQLEYQQNLMSCLISDIENETRTDISRNNLTKVLIDVNQTLIISRELTEQSDELDQQINKINDEIDRKQCLLDELELDDALDQNIDIDSLNDDDDDLEESSFLFRQERVSIKDNTPSPSPSPTILSQKTQKIGIRKLSLNIYFSMLH